MAAKMTGRVCVITGASRGIGKASAEALASLGASLILVCRRQTDGDKVASEISRPQNPSPEVVAADLPSGRASTSPSVCGSRVVGGDSASWLTVAEKRWLGACRISAHALTAPRNPSVELYQPGSNGLARVLTAGQLDRIVQQ